MSPVLFCHTLKCVWRSSPLTEGEQNFLRSRAGFAREVFLADRFGTTYIADAYVIAASLPSVLFALFASGFTQSFIPSYVRADP